MNNFLNEKQNIGTNKSINNSYIKNSNENLNMNSSLQIKGQYQQGNSIRPNSTPQNNPNQRSFSYDQKERNQNNLDSNNQKKDVMKIIISPQVQNVYNQNVNNIYIQNPQYDVNRPNQNNQQINARNNHNSYQNTNIQMNNRPNSVTKKDNKYSLNENNRQDYRPQTRPENTNMIRSNENQRLMQNNYFSDHNAIE